MIDADPVEEATQPGDAATAEDAASRTAQLEHALEVAREVFRRIPLPFEHLEGRQEGDDLYVMLQGLSVEPDSLDGRMFESLQFLLNKSIQRHGNRRSRLHLQVEGIKARRREHLEPAAARLVEHAVSKGRVLTLGPLGDGDLRNWTFALQRHGGAQIQAMGPNESRRLRVVPPGANADNADRRPRKRRRRRRG